MSDTWAKAIGESDLATVVSHIDERYRPVWKNRGAEEQRALALYFLPRVSRRTALAPTRPRLIKWYCPFAPQSEFPSGHRYCLNVYTGCQHRCSYCYARSYQPETAAAKARFASLLAADLDDLERFDVPPAPIHLSNSTDPFQQPLERKLGCTALALESIARHRGRFSAVVILTRNPSFAAEPRYLSLLRDLQGASADGGRLVVEVSLPFWDDSARRFIEPAAPSVPARIDGINALRESGLSVVVRIDPLFPRSPLPLSPPQTLTDFGLPELQSMDDLQALVEFAVRVGAAHVVYSPCKIVRPRRSGLDPVMASLKRLYDALSRPVKPVWHGMSWRLPGAVARDHVVAPFLEICAARRIAAKFCMRNLVETV